MTQDGPKAQTSQTGVKGLSCRMAPCPLCSRSLRPLWAVLILSILLGGGTFFTVVLYPVISKPLVLPPALESQSKLKTTHLTIIKQAAQVPVALDVELAASPIEQEKGLMFREVVPEGTGMLFPFDPPRPVAFWMKNTRVPLDMIFIGTDNRIIRIAPNTVPYDLTSVPSGGPVSAVLEIGGGQAQRLGLSVGDLLAQ